MVHSMASKSAVILYELAIACFFLWQHCHGGFASFAEADGSSGHGPPI